MAVTFNGNMDIYVEIQQEDPSENYAPTLGWRLRLFLGGSLFIDGVLFTYDDIFIDVCRLLYPLIIVGQ